MILILTTGSSQTIPVYSSEGPGDTTITKITPYLKTAVSSSLVLTQLQLLPTSVTRDTETANSFHVCNSSSVIVVSAVSLLLIVTLITVIIIQCLLILRMRKSKDVLHSSNETYAESSMNVDVPTTPNDAYTLHKITRPSEEVTYETMQ